MARAAQLQIGQGREWAARAQRQHFADAEIPAPRGAIFDVAGVPLAQSRELVRLSVAPRELRERRAAAREMQRLGVPREWIARATDSSRAWVTLPGRYLPAQAAALAASRGVYTQPVFERFYVAGADTRRLIGRVNSEGGAVDGIELALDTMLRGIAGRATVLRDARGRRFESPTGRGIAPEPGDDIVTTINRELQQIAERALATAVARMDADGGDIVILDPHSGEVRALVSKRGGPSAGGSPALAEPFEPGSTLKPFIAAALLSLGRATADEVMNTENGVYTIEGRTITDTHRDTAMTLADVIHHSSNVGIVKFAQRLSPQEEYETLRDLGFGTPTGVPYPSEAAGTLRPPRKWSRQSQASLAMGYEIAVTPLQLAAAYAAIANGGELLEPALVKEVRAHDGTVRYRHERRVVRRTMSAEVAAAVREMLVGTVRDGTAGRAGLGTFAVAGKTGTARRTAGGRGYAPNQYTASFVGLFPADRPQYVILVKLDNPATEYYGGKAAAPVSRVVLEAAIAARDAALDRVALAASESVAATQHVVREAAAAEAAAHLAHVPPAPARPHVVAVPATARAHVAGSPRSVPDVEGLPVRAAVRTLHQAGFQVQLAGSGSAAHTYPRAGALARAGSVIRLVSAR